MKQEDYLVRHSSWQKYAEKEINAGRKPIPFKDWKVSPVYFRGMPKQTYESQFKAAGEDVPTGEGYKKNKPKARLKRSEGK